MNGKHYVGKKAQSFEQYEDVKVDGIRIANSDGTQFLAGNQDGYVLDINCPYATQEMADDLYAMLGGNVYRGYRATNAILDPQAELGDGVTINGIYSNLAYRRVDFGPSHTSEIAAPGESTLNHEYNYVSPTQREINKKADENKNQLENFAKTITEYIDTIKKQADAKAETWYQAEDPSTGWSDAEKKEHGGDLWYETTTGNFYVYDGSKWSVTTSEPPEYVFDEIDKKAQIFVSQPVPPYNENDLWFGGTDVPIKVCINSRTEGEKFQDSDWEKKDNYIDEADAIVNVLQQYYSSDSPTTISGGNWQNTQPTWTQGKYIWSRQYVTYGDGRKAYLPSESGVCITGNTGANGSNGKDGAPGANGTNGVGVKSITNYYLATNLSSGVTDKTPGWSTNVQSVSSTKPYLWNYEVTVYTDGNSTTIEPHVVGTYGRDGENGTAGKGISTITEHYLATASSSGVTSNTPGWTEALQRTDTTNRYLWNYETITYTDGSSSTVAPRIIGTHGATGASGENGKNGIGIDTIVAEYILSPSDTSPEEDPMAEWGPDIPEPMEGLYIWTRQVVTYSDGHKEYAGLYCMSKTMGDIAQKVVDSQTQDDIVKKLTNNYEWQGLFWEGNDLYINAKYLRGENIDLNVLRLAGTICGLMEGFGSANIVEKTNGIVVYGNGLDVLGYANPPYIIITNRGIRGQSDDNHNFNMSGDAFEITGDFFAHGKASLKNLVFESEGTADFSNADIYGNYDPLWTGSLTSGYASLNADADKYSFFIVTANPSSSSSAVSVIVPSGRLGTRFQAADNNHYVSFTLSSDRITYEASDGSSSTRGIIHDVIGVK